MKKISLAVCLLTFIMSYAFGGIALEVVPTQVDNGSTVVTVPVALYNPDDLVAGVQMDVYVDPFIPVDSVHTTLRTDGFNLSYANLPDNGVRIILFSMTGVEIPDTAGSVVDLFFNVTGYMNSIFNITLENTVVSGMDGESLDHQVKNNALRVGQNVDLFVMPASGDAGTGGNIINVSLDNEDPIAPVGGIQFDLSFMPDFLMVDTIYVTDRALDFEVDYSELDRTGRVILYSPSGATIDPGVGPVITMEVFIDVYAGPQDVIVHMDNVVVGDPDGNSIATVVLDGIFTIEHGYKFPPTNLTAVSSLDGHIPLAWAPPEQGGGGGPGEAWSEGFESADFPPPGWTQVITNTSVTWMQYTDEYAYEGTYSAGLWWDYSHQDEWLITPPFTVGGNTILTFWTYGWEGSTYGDHYYVKISTDGGSNWDVLLDLSALTGNDWNAWAYPYEIDLSGYAGEDVLLAWQAVDGDGGGLWYIWMIDAIDVSEGERSVFSFNTGLQGVIPSGVIAREDAGEAPENVESNFIPTVYRNVRESSSLIGYNIYRSETSPVEITPPNLIASVDSAVLAYDDTSVVNGVEYFYVVTADYGDFGESGPSNEVSAMAVRWVHLNLSPGEGDPGSTGSIFVAMDNEQPVGGFQISIRDIPNWLSYASAATTPRTSGWVVSGSEQADGSCLVLGYNLMGGVIDPGIGDIVEVTFNIDPEAPIGDVQLLIEDAVISDQTGEYAFPWEGEGNVFLVGTPEVVFEVPDTSYTVMGDPMVLDVTMTNSKSVGGFQFDIADPGNHLTPTGIEHSLPSAWIVMYNELSNGDVRVLGYTMTGDSIVAGSSTTFSLTFDYDDTMGEGLYWMDVIGTIASDPNGNGLFAAGKGGWMVMLPPQAPPSPVNLIYPENNHSWNIQLADTNLVEQFKWTSSFDPNGDLVNYGVMFGDVNGNEIPMPLPSDNDGMDTTLTLRMADILPLIGGVLDDIEPGTYVFDGYWYVLASDGIFSVPSDINNLHVEITYTSTDEEVSNIPDDYSLSQNYPNPFNPTTTIWYGLPRNDRVTLIVYNLLGQEIRTLVDGEIPAGMHSVRWDGRDNAGNMVRSGMYFYKIQTSEFTKTNKMLLMK